VLGLPEDAVGEFRVGKGLVIRRSLSPAELTYHKEGAEQIRDLVGRAAGVIGEKWRESNALVLRRGPFVVAAGISESTPGAGVQHLDGRFINLFDSELKTLTRFELTPDTRALLVDINALAAKEPAVAAASCRIRDLQCKSDSVSFTADRMAESQARVLLLMGWAPRSVTINGDALPQEGAIYADGILRLEFSNASGPRRIDILR
jgi:hypothetical protein